MGFRLDLKDREFGKWTVIRFVGNTKRGMSIWLCRCECGRERSIPIGNLRSGNSTQCSRCASKGKNLIHGLSGTLVCFYWLRHRKTFGQRWKESLALFNGECWSHRTKSSQQLRPVDENQLIGLGNFRWVSNPAEEIRRQEAASFLVSEGIPLAKAEKRMKTASRQRVYQILNRRDGLCEKCGSKAGCGKDCIKCKLKARSSHNKQKTNEYLNNGYILLSDAIKLTGSTAAIVCKHCRTENTGWQTVVDKKDAEKLIVPAGWKTVSAAARHVRVYPNALHYHIKKGRLQSRRIRGGVFVLIDEAEALISG